jgi:hypothetical protein
MTSSEKSPTPTEQPEFRGFGTKKKEASSFTKPALIVLLLAIIGVGGYAAIPLFSTQKAPPMNAGGLLNGGPNMGQPPALPPQQPASDAFNAQAAAQEQLALAAANAASGQVGANGEILPNVPPVPVLTVDQKLAKLTEIHEEIKVQMDEYKLISNDLVARMQKAESTLEALEKKAKQAASTAAANKAAANQAPKTVSTAMADQPKQAAPESKKGKGDDFVALTIVEINGSNVVVKDAQQKQYTVTPGAKLPGGAMFIGFEAKTRTMRTDVGDFQVP